MSPIAPIRPSDHSAPSCHVGNASPAGHRASAFPGRGARRPTPVFAGVLVASCAAGAALGAPLAAWAAGAPGGPAVPGGGTGRVTAAPAPGGGPMHAGVPILAPATVHSFPADSSNVRIAMTENDTGNVIVSASGGVAAPGVAGAQAVMFHPDGAGVWTVSTSTGCAGPTWTPVGGTVATPTASPVVAGADLTLCGDNGTSTTDQGTITGVYNSAGQARTVNTLPLEEYVADVVPAESPSYWGTLGGAGPQSHDWGFQELEAQAVAVRSYVLADPGGYGGYATTCDLGCQSYRGTRYATPLSEAAAQDTAGDVMVMPDGAIATTEYAASTGGYTAGTAESSPFDAVPDTGDAICMTPPPAGFSRTAVCNPSHDWSVTIPLSQVQAKWPLEGAAPTVTVAARNGLGTWGGRATRVTVTGNGTQQTMDAYTFVDGLGLKSDYFTITSAPGQPLAITGHGWGPGVGMGQWGALGYAVGADNGQGTWTWQKILGHFYSPATLGTLPGGAATTPSPSSSGEGYWLADAAGDVFSFGGAGAYGSMAGDHLNQPVVGMAATPAGTGYWLVAKDGGIFSFGTARFYGSMGGDHLNAPIVGMAPAPTGAGYWLVASDGGIFSFGTARFYGSMGGDHLNAPIVGMAPAPTGAGYWLVASDGGIFSFGTARFYGSTGALVLNRPIVGMAATPAGTGYWLVASDGGIFNFGTAGFLGSAVGTGAGQDAAAVVATAPAGYLIAAADGEVAAFGSATASGGVPTLDPGYDGQVVAAAAG
jgi:SpoIID/LytB domain protein